MEYAEPKKNKKTSFFIAGTIRGIATAVIVSIFISTTFTYANFANQYNEIIKSADVIGTEVIPKISNNLWIGDYQKAIDLAQKIMTEKHFAYFRLYTLEEPVVELGKPLSSDGLAFKWPLIDSRTSIDYQLGYLHLEISLEGLYAELIPLFIKYFIMMMLSSLFVLYSLWFWFKKHTLIPLLVLTRRFQRAENDSMPHKFYPVAEVKHQEINTLTTEYNNMINNISDLFIKLKKDKNDAYISTQNKSEYIANISHEIRTPMSGIVGVASLLKKTQLDKKQKNYLDLLESSSFSLLDVINDIIDFSQMEAGKIQLNKIEFNLMDLLKDIKHLFNLRIKEKSVVFHCNFDESLNDLFLGDSSRIRQVLINLVGNAVKFTDKGEINFTVKKIKKTDNKIRVLFEISDTGAGIKQTDRQSIFRKFEQIKKSSKKYKTGTGLGLTISNQLIEMMGSCLSFESKVNEGSCFHFCLALENIVVSDSEHRAHSYFLTTPAIILYESELNARINKKLFNELNIKTTLIKRELDFDTQLRKLIKTLPQKHFISIDNKTGTNEVPDAIKTIKSQSGQKNHYFILMTDPSDGKIEKNYTSYDIDALLIMPFKKSQLKQKLIKLLAEIDFIHDDDIHVELNRQDAILGFEGEVLLVEDTIVNQRVTEAILSDMGLNVTVVNHGKEALKCCEKQGFDLILMDCQMPVMDGFQATRILREHRIAEGVPIVALTANTTTEDKRNCFNAGMDDFVTKPLSKLTLENVLRKHILIKSGPKQISEEKHNS